MRPKRSLGQNFLVDPDLQRRIVEAVEAGPGDPVLEIGPGRGALTRHLVERADRLILVELDDELVADLRERYGGRDDVEVVHGDVLELEIGDLVEEPRRLFIVGNIPYNITTPILFRLLERPRPRDIVVTVQKEVGARIAAEPGSSAFGALSVGVRSVAGVSRLFDVSRSAFRPVPDVDSTVLRIRPFDPPPLSRSEEENLRSLTRAAFQWRRKQFGTTLRKHPSYDLSAAELDRVEDETGFDLRRRPETFSPGEFVRLARLMERMERPLERPG